MPTAREADIRSAFWRRDRPAGAIVAAVGFDTDRVDVVTKSINR